MVYCGFFGCNRLIARTALSPGFLQFDFALRPNRQSHAQLCREQCDRLERVAN